MTTNDIEELIRIEKELGDFKLSRNLEFEGDRFFAFAEFEDAVLRYYSAIIG